MPSKSDANHPHQDSPVLRLGCDLQSARRAMIMLHGRGASAQDIAGVATAFELPADMIVLAPQASSNIWYPQRLTATLESNEPYLSSAIRRIEELVAELSEHGIQPEQIIIAGFSQGASLSIEFILRHPARWGGLLAFSGGFIWPLGIPREVEGQLLGTPVFLGCSDVDPFIPLQRVMDTATALAEMGAQVTRRIYPGMEHTIIQNEIDLAQSIITQLT